MLPVAHGLQQLILSPTTPVADDAKFGASVAIGSVGGYMVVGEKGFPQKAYVYVESGDTWSCTDTLTASSNNFGKFVASYDETIVVSNQDYSVSSTKGHAFVYKLMSGKAMMCDCFFFGIIHFYLFICMSFQGVGRILQLLFQMLVVTRNSLNLELQYMDPRLQLAQRIPMM